MGTNDGDTPGEPAPTAHFAGGQLASGQFGHPAGVVVHPGGPTLTTCRPCAQHVLGCAGVRGRTLVGASRSVELASLWYGRPTGQEFVERH